MSIRSGVDPSPLIWNSDLEDTVSFEQDSASVSVSGATLTDFQRTPAAVDDDAGRAPSWRRPVRSTSAYLSRLSDAFSWKFLSWLALNNFALWGGVMTLLNSVGLPLFKEMGIDASRQQLYTTMILSPYALKPFIGVTSDLFLVKGYNKKYLCLMAIVLGIVGCSALLVMFHTGSAAAAVSSGPDSVRRLADLIVTCFFAMNLEGATLDVLGEGKYSELMRIHPESGSSIITFKFMCSLAGMIVTQTYVGPLSDRGHFHVIFWIALVLLLTPFFPTLRGWIPEKKRTSREKGMAKICFGCAFDRGLFRTKRTPFIAIALSGLAAPVTSAVSTFADLRIGLVCSGFILLALAATTYAIFPRRFFRITLGLMLLVLCRIRMTSGLSYFYTANSKCLPDGPQFSYTFYITLTGIVGSVIHMVAVILYQAIMSSWRFRPALVFSMAVGSLATIVDLIIVLRWNVAMGVPDKVFFLLGNATFEQLTNILHAIPMSAISAKLAPPGMESAVFAYSVGIGTFCFMVSNLLGSGIIEWSGMKTVGDECNFDSLPNLIVIFQILIPLLVGIPATLFIPNVYQTDKLIDWEKEQWYEDGREDQQTGDPQEEAHDDEAFGAGVVEPLIV